MYLDQVVAHAKPVRCFSLKNRETEWRNVATSLVIENVLKIRCKKVGCRKEAFENWSFIGIILIPTFNKITIRWIDPLIDPFHNDVLLFVPV